jgi:disulfide bond formation protein DsbB
LPGAVDALGYELWTAFVVAAIATGGSLFSEIAGFIPCELCWFQRICMYPLSIVTLLAALAGDFRVARYLLPLPMVGTGVSGERRRPAGGQPRQHGQCAGHADLIAGKSGTRGRQVALTSATDEAALVRAIDAALR